MIATKMGRGTQRTPVVSLRNCSKTFAGVNVLRDVNLDIEGGEIRGLLGQNGSGKSTLIKILSGYHTPDEGTELCLGGELVEFPVTAATRRHCGIAVLHQDLGLVGDLSALENLLVGRYPVGRLRKVSWRRERIAAYELVERYGIHIDLNARVDELSDIERALLAIVRTLKDVWTSDSGGLLILDEPTVHLPIADVDRLFEVMQGIARLGTALLFVTHQLREAKAVTDRVTVLRSGSLVDTVETTGVSEDELITMIVGREIGELYPQKVTAPPEAALLQVEDVGDRDVEAVSFGVHPGEIVGLTGLVGSGFERVVYLLYGALEATSGHLRIGADTIKARDMSPARAIALGMILVPANRLRDGIVPDMSVASNVGLPVLKEHTRFRVLRERSLNAAVEGAISALDVVPRDVTRIMQTLSGGNQQKTVLAKWLQLRPSILLLHEPTQGVDVGARQQIFASIRDAAAGGAAVVISSSECSDLAHLCTTVRVFRRGRERAVITGEDVTEDRVVAETLKDD